MLTLLVGMAIGLVIGWNLLPQPKWVKDKYDKLVDWVKQTTG
jgi:hypothetical protein